MTLLRNPLASVLLGVMLGVSLYPCARTYAQASPATRSVTSVANKDDNLPADLAGDTRLDRRISLHEIGIPLSALLLKVNDAEVSLSADRNCDALKLHLNLLNRPLRHFMNSLAELIPGSWYKMPDGKGYVLRMSQSATIRRQRWWNLFLEERQRLWEILPERALQTMQLRPEIKGEITSADGNHEGFKQQLLAGPTFFNLLPAWQQKIAHSVNQTPYYQERGLILSTGMNEGAVIVPFTDLPEQAQKPLAARLHVYSPQTDPADSNYVLFENVGSGISADVVNSSGDVLTTGFSMDVKWDAERPAFNLDHEGLPKRVKQLGRNAPSVWKELAAYQESRVWPNALPAKSHLSYENRAEVLEWLADTAHLEFVADYYSLIWGTRHSILSAQMSLPLQEELNKLAGELDLSWKRVGDVCLFRNNRWYRDDGLEVPAPLLRRWLSQNVREWAKQSASTSPVSKAEQTAQNRRLLDWQAEVVSTLTPWQIFNGLAFVTLPPDKREQYAWGLDMRHVSPDAAEAHIPYAPFKRQVQNLIFRYRLMLLYASLSAEQRTALLAGNLDFHALTGEQEQQAIYLQPLLQIRLSRRERPILLGLRQRQPSFLLSMLDDADLHLVITAPTMQPPALNSGLPGQQAP